MYAPVHSSIIHNSQGLEVTQISIREGLDKQNIVQTNNVTLVVVVWSIRHVQLMTPWTVAHQAPLSMGFSRQEY